MKYLKKFENSKDIESLKSKIDSMSHEELARIWRYGSSDNELLQGEAGDYFKKRLFDHFGGFNPTLSKGLGWSNDSRNRDIHNESKIEIIEGEEELENPTKWGYIRYKLDGQEFTCNPYYVKLKLKIEELVEKGYDIKDIEDLCDLQIDSCQRDSRDDDMSNSPDS